MLEHLSEVQTCFGLTPSSAPGQRPYLGGGQVTTRSHRSAQNLSMAVQGHLSHFLSRVQPPASDSLSSGMSASTSHLPGHFCQRSRHLLLSYSCPASFPAKAVVTSASPIHDQAPKPHLDRYLIVGNDILGLGFLFWFPLIVPDFRLGVSPVSTTQLYKVGICITICSGYNGTRRLRKVKWPIRTCQW